LIGDPVRSELSAEDDPGAEGRERDALEHVIDRPIYLCPSYQQGRRERGENHVGTGVGKTRTPHAPDAQTQPGQDNSEKDREDGSGYKTDEGGLRTLSIPRLRWSASPASPNPSLVIQRRTITAAMAGEKAIGICTREFSSDNPSSSRATKIVDQASPKASNRCANTPLVFIVIGRCFLPRNGAERQELAVARQNQPQVATQQLVPGPCQDGEGRGEHQGRREAPHDRHLPTP
jgi:hypothetical protein